MDQQRFAEWREAASASVPTLQRFVKLLEFAQQAPVVFELLSVAEQKRTALEDEIVGRREEAARALDGENARQAGIIAQAKQEITALKSEAARLKAEVRDLTLAREQARKDFEWADTLRRELRGKLAGAAGEHSA